MELRLKTTQERRIFEDLRRNWGDNSKKILEKYDVKM
jgi:hypothetical protein